MMDDGFEYFDRRAAETTGQRHVPKGARFYHGYQGDPPVLNDNRPLWMTTDQTEAAQYRDFGRRKPSGGVIVLMAKKDIVALKMMPQGRSFLLGIGRTDHGFYGECLHRWAVWRGHYLIDEGGEAFISMRPALDFEIVDTEGTHLNSFED